MSKLTMIVGHDIGYGTYDNPDKVQIQWGDSIEWFVKESIKDNAYSERNKLLALACRMALELGYKVGRWYHEGEEAGWGWLVSILLPSGWVDWHIPNDQIDWFEGLPVITREWEDYATEEKYQRVLSYAMG